MFCDGKNYFLLCVEVYCLYFLVLFANAEKEKLSEIETNKVEREMFSVFLQNRHDQVFMQKFKKYKK